MFKRIFSFFIVIAILLTSIPMSIESLADDEYNPTDNSLENDIDFETKVSSDYRDYIKEYADINPAENSVNVLENSEIKVKSNRKIDIDFSVADTAKYVFIIEYTTLDNSNENITLSANIDGEYLFDELSNITLPRYFADTGKKRVDNNGNEVSKKVKQVAGRYEYKLKDANNTQFLYVVLKEGTHILTVANKSEDFILNSISFAADEKTDNYKNYLNSHKSAKEINDFKTVECENSIMKSSDNIVQLSDSSSSNVSPFSAYKDKINYTGGKNWDQPGESITWEISVPKTGLYKLGVNFRQNYTQNAVFYREIAIDGSVPFEEAKKIEFPYALDWRFIEISDKNGNPYYFYLTKGVHSITFSVTLGELSDVSRNLDEVSLDIATFYRKIIMITGDTPDANRDYNLFNRIENFESSLKQNIKKLRSITSKLDKIYGSESVSSISTVNEMINVMDLMLEHKFTAHKYLNRYYDSYASLNALIIEMKSMPLDFDMLYFGGDFSNTKTGIIDSLIFGFQKFIYSFVSDYNTVNKTDDGEKITIWVNWGRDQAKVLKYLTQSDFSVKNKIDVDIKITNATLTHAALSGNGPDCQLHLSRSEPVNLAMRGAVCDLSRFSDFDNISNRFQKNSMNCYRFGDGIYAIPDTQSFFMMFVRTDILDEMGMDIPKTWQEFIDASILLSRKNLQIGLPYTQIAEMTQVNLGVGALSIFPTLLIQNGGELYNINRSKTKLLSETSVKAFEEWTNYYTKYGCPKTYDFFNRFRLGLMPIAIQNYTMYATVSAAAPEIDGKWEMYELPGVPKDDGTISNITSGGGTGAAILSASEHKEAAWKFIKWWTDEETQYSYATEVENILGSAARVNTSNINALKKLTWKKSTLNNILSQWDKVEEMPEVPGGYYISRVLDQAFWNVTNAGENPIDMLMKWSNIAQTEIDRKREQYGIE